MTKEVSSVENDAALRTIYVMVDNAAHVMIPPDVDDLGWSCSQASKPGAPQCSWRASEAFSNDAMRRESFLRHHNSPAEKDATSLEQAWRDGAIYYGGDAAEQWYFNEGGLEANPYRRTPPGNSD